jgi:hypothetical protein
MLAIAAQTEADTATEATPPGWPFTIRSHNRLDDGNRGNVACPGSTGRSGDIALTSGSGVEMKITPQLLQLVSIIIAPVAALAGVWMASQLSGRVEHRRWLRERRAEAYISVLQSADQVSLSKILQRSIKRAALETVRGLEEKSPKEGTIRSEDIAEPTRALIEQAREEIAAVWMPFARADNEVAIFGSEAAYKAARRVTRAAMHEDLDKGIKLSNEDILNLINTCRKDLKSLAE